MQIMQRLLAAAISLFLTFFLLLSSSFFSFFLRLYLCALYSVALTNLPLGELAHYSLTHSARRPLTAYLIHSPTHATGLLAFHANPFIFGLTLCYFIACI